MCTNGQMKALSQFPELTQFSDRPHYLKERSSSPEEESCNPQQGYAILIFSVFPEEYCEYLYK